MCGKPTGKEREAARGREDIKSEIKEVRAYAGT